MSTLAQTLKNWRGEADDLEASPAGREDPAIAATLRGCAAQVEASLRGRDPLAEFDAAVSRDRRAGEQGSRTYRPEVLDEIRRRWPGGEVIREEQIRQVEHNVRAVIAGQQRELAALHAGQAATPGMRWVELPEQVADSFQHVGLLDRDRFDADYSDMHDLLRGGGWALWRVREALLVAAALGRYELTDTAASYDRVRGYSFERKDAGRCGS